ncbi:hypothetical protein [Exiguobacterium sp. s80]|uniref:hypothetical protein n=1 Tax=Exiguobacterium sp. s80 TaxID=2751209 RepID=UPI001BE56004|nr:hypothetical protein [Exiguobacterium sp. s80]
MKYINEESMPEKCPPATAKSEDVENVFRFLEEADPQELDFDNHLKRNLFYTKDRLCEAIALSFFTTDKKVAEMRIRFPEKFESATILKGNIRENAGVHKTKRQHLNLWVFHGVKMFEEFTRKEEVGR